MPMKLFFSSFNYVSRKKLSINGKHNVYQHCTPSVTMYIHTKYNPERFLIVPKQEDEVYIQNGD